MPPSPPHCEQVELRTKSTGTASCRYMAPKDTVSRISVSCARPAADRAADAPRSAEACAAAMSAALMKEGRVAWAAANRLAERMNHMLDKTPTRGHKGTKARVFRQSELRAVLLTRCCPASGLNAISTPTLRYALLSD
jgi:hypothetical protein